MQQARQQLQQQQCHMNYSKLLAIALRTIAIAIAIVAKKAIEYCNMQ